jgi:hypothetical protein
MTQNVLPTSTTTNPGLISTLVIGPAIEMSQRQPMPLQPRGAHRAPRPVQDSMVRLAVLNVLRAAPCRFRY